MSALLMAMLTMLAYVNPSPSSGTRHPGKATRQVGTVHTTCATRRVKTDPAGPML